MATALNMVTCKPCFGYGTEANGDLCQQCGGIGKVAERSRPALESGPRVQYFRGARVTKPQTSNIKGK